MRKSHFALLLGLPAFIVAPAYALPEKPQVIECPLKMTVSFKPEKSIPTMQFRDFETDEIEFQRLEMFDQDPKKKMSLSRKGKSQTSEWRQHRMGWHHTEKAKEKIGKATRLRYDKIGRKKYKRYRHFTETIQYKKWRKAVFERDSYTCQVCQKVGGYLEAHHIKSWAKYPKLRYKINNGITLCKKCHKKTNNYEYKKS